MNRLNIGLSVIHDWVKQSIRALFTVSIVLSALVLNTSVYAETKLADNPLFSTTGVPGNVALALSVEFPTALGSAYTTAYDINKEYVGYWNSDTCYAYKAPPTFQGPYNTGVDDNNVKLANGSNDPHWVATSTPRWITNDQANDVSGAWDWDPVVASDADSAYIGGSSRSGKFVYETSFNIPADVDPTLVTISFDLYADDRLDQVKVNGTNATYTLNGTPAWNTSATVTLPAGTFTSRTNQKITLDINNASNGLGGMRVDNMTATVSGSGSYFEPKSVAATAHVCNQGAVKYWSGNFLNWALTQTIDPFRYALSGGYRAIDTESLTVLEKAWATGQGGTVVDQTIGNNSTLIAQSTPFQSSNNLRMRISGLGNKFYITGSTSIDRYNPGGNLVADGQPLNNINTKIYEMSARVQVCDAAFLESNCTRYPSGYYKPTGLIQENAMKLNFAAFGYLLDSDYYRDGGVLRARMGPLGPEKPVPGSSAVANANAEWDAFTGVFYTNPNATDATASGVANSGVINYLNKFGLTAKLYKTYDPVGELYYAATRYFKNQGNVAAYTSNLDDTKKDGFPVITTWDDPIKYACQANFIIGIGDTNTWQDGNLPGSTVRSGEPTMPTEVSADNTVDTKLATNKVGALEGIPGYNNLGDQEAPWCCSNNTFLMAGLAYDSHTKDIRPGNLPQEAGKQTIATYFLDVLEAGDRKDYSSTGMWNQYWLAAKYGGFNNVPDTFDPYAATVALATADWDANGDGDPDNYFRANQPQLMIDGLKKAFDDIVVKSQQGTSVQFSLESPEVTVGDLALDTAYDGDGWTGDVVAGTITFVNSKPVATKIWSAAEKLAGQNWDTERFIATSKCSDPNADGTISCKNMGIPFRDAADLSTSNSADLTVLGNTAQNVIDFLRGDTSKDGTNGFRIRKSTNGILGDIANSQLTMVGPPSFFLDEYLNPGYYSFKTAKASRQSMVYVGANDGMLHAFNATSGGAGGKEQFAYVPSMLFKGPTNNPGLDGLVALSKEPYLHHHYVDATPTVSDVYFNDADSTGDGGWHTLLVGGLGKGGKGYYAIDVTDPNTLNNETKLANAVKWEFTHQDLGYSYSKPVIVKVHDTTVGSNGWVVIFTSGYNNIDKNGYFFVLNPETGELIKKVQTYTSPPSTDAGLASPNVYINSYRGFAADAAYAGDLHGNVWRLNLANFTVTQLARFTDNSNVPQPITTRVGVSKDIATGKRYILVGTGRLLDDTDAGNTQTQSIYAIGDGTGAKDGYLTALTTPSGGGTSGGGFPITRSNLDNNSTLYATTGITSPSANSLGWYMDLEDNYIVNIDLKANAGVLYIAANKVIGGVCDSTSSGRAFQINFASGQTATEGVAYTSVPGTITNISLYRDEDGKIRARFGYKKDGDGGGGTVDPDPPKPSSGAKFRQMNWRDLPLAE